MTGLNSARVARALELAADLHQEQVRKGTSVPYVGHLLAVAALVLEDGGTEDQLIAALLHDAAEDQGGEPTIQLIGSEFGPVVAEIVRDCSDSLVEDPTRKAAWRERKEAALRSLETVSPAALLVVAADKLHNVRSTVVDVRRDGPRAWERFTTGRDGFIWYHEAVLAVLRRRLPSSRSVVALGQDLSELVATSSKSPGLP